MNLFSRNRIIHVLLMAVCCFFLLTGCSKTTAKKILHVNFADAGWDSIRFQNAIGMYIGKTAYNIEPEEKSGSTPITFSALKSGDIQVYMELWADNIPEYKDDVKNGSIVEIGDDFDDNKQGFYVPRYVIEGDKARGIKATAPELKTVKDLKKYAKVFQDPDDQKKGRIYGAISGWDMDKKLRTKYKAYGLDKEYNYIDPGSSSALEASFTGAIERGEPIVGYYWEPAWLTGKYDLVLLQDDPYTKEKFKKGLCEFPSMTIKIGVSKDFPKEAPEFCNFLRKYNTTSQLISDALAYMQNNKASFEDTAKWYLKQHDKFLDEWLPTDKAKLVRESLKN